MRDPGDRIVRGASHIMRLELDGMDRQALVLPSASLAPKPLLLGIHGCGSNPEIFAAETGLPLAAVRRGWHVVLLNGTNLNLQRQRLANGSYTREADVAPVPGVPAMHHLGFNAGSSMNHCYTLQRTSDVVLVVRVLALALEQLCVDESAMYLAGMSNGAAMAANLSCSWPGGELPFAAVAWTGAEIARSAYPMRCGKSRVRPTLGVAGTYDRPSVNGQQLWFTAVGDSFACGSEQSFVPTQGTKCAVRTRCNVPADDTELQVCVVRGMKHCWPGQWCCDDVGHKLCWGRGLGREGCHDKQWEPGGWAKAENRSKQKPPFPSTTSADLRTKKGGSDATGLYGVRDGFFCPLPISNQFCCGGWRCAKGKTSVCQPRAGTRCGPAHGRRLLPHSPGPNHGADCRGLDTTVARR